MIFDYILNNRFYIQNDDVASPQEEKTNPLADVIPTTPHNRLETFLNMIVGEFKGMAAVDPIKPISEMEYWLNEIAAAKGGNPWKDAAGKFVAKKINIDIGSDDELRSFTWYSLTIDTGLNEFPYSKFYMEGEANGCEITSEQVPADDLTPLDKEIENGDKFESPKVLRAAGLLLDGDINVEVFPGDPGLLLGGAKVCFIKNGDDTIKTQVLMSFVYNDSERTSYDNEADELIFDTFDLKFVEAQ